MTVATSSEGSDDHTRNNRKLIPTEKLVNRQKGIPFLPFSPHSLKSKPSGNIGFKR